MNKFSKYVGLDTHKDTITVAIADAAGGKPRFYGEISNTPIALLKLLARTVKLFPIAMRQGHAGMVSTARSAVPDMSAVLWRPR